MTNSPGYAYVRIEEKAINLTTAQAIKSVEVCQSLSNMLRDIYLFRFDPLTGNIYILASESIEIVINQNGEMKFV
ncbi:hypothetical protein LEP3755_57130 [Leptolyngbya sp. NIES-3755]|nr:hypothetical protein LEP3755_57130 [Leptolyngbya sp. NIES-3755]